MWTRIRIILIFFNIFFLVIIARLFYWQVLRNRELSLQAKGQHSESVKIGAKRGEILASDGSWLVANAPSWLVYASLPDLKDSPSKIAEKIAPFFIEKQDNYDKNLLQEIERIKELLNRKKVVWVPLKNRLDGATKEKIESLGISGLGFEMQQTRFYPEASTAAHLLGFVGKDEEGKDQGYFGLEGYYDLVLSGKPGFLNRESDALGIPLAVGVNKEISAVEGVNLLTSVDKAIQLLLERKLVEGISKYGAKAGSVVVMDPTDGKILGMSSYPSFDPSRYYEYKDELFLNPVISTSFEPGSIFKVIVMASALDASVVEPDTKCDTCDGPLKIGQYTIRTWNNVYHPNSSMVDIIVNSDNVGMAFVGKKLGVDRLYNYLKLFGFGEKSGIDLQGEFSPKVREKNKWSEIDLATASFGQGIAVTPIQMVRAVSAIANKGVMVRPHVVRKIVSKDWEKVVYPNETKRVISEEAAEKVTAMMVEAAKKGEAKWTYLRGFRVAGKTGTAQIPIAGHYDEEKTIASFVGFAPSDQPRFVMLVTLREPTSSPWASETAAPLWYSIAGELFKYFGILPEE